jgi:hypothetical protein
MAGPNGSQLKFFFKIELSRQVGIIHQKPFNLFFKNNMDAIAIQKLDNESGFQKIAGHFKCNSCYFFRPA